MHERMEQRVEPGTWTDPVAVVNLLDVPCASMQVDGTAESQIKKINNLYHAVSGNADSFLSSPTEEINCGVKSFHEPWFGQEYY